MTSRALITSFNNLHGKIVTKEKLSSLLVDVKKYVHAKRVDSHGPQGQKIIDISERLSKVISKLNGQPVRIKLSAKISPEETLRVNIKGRDAKGFFVGSGKKKKHSKKLAGDVTDVESFMLGNNFFKYSGHGRYDLMHKVDGKEKLILNGNTRKEVIEYVKKKYPEKLTEFLKVIPGKVSRKQKTLPEITPALNKKVLELAVRIAGKEGVNTEKEFNKAFDKAIKEFGYSVDHYHKTMREIGPEYPEDYYESLSGKKVTTSKRKKKKLFNKFLNESSKKVVKVRNEYVEKIKSKNISGVNYKYKEVDLGKYKKDFHRMFSDTIVQIHGMPGHGKTVFLLEFAQSRAEAGEHVLYVAREEYGKSVFDMKLKDFKINHKNLRFRKTLEPADLKWATVVIMDSVTALDIDDKEMEKLATQYPNRNWYLILQSTKSGTFRGSQKWEHLVDIAGEVRNREMILSKNRLDPNNKDKADKLRVGALVAEKTEALEIKNKVKEAFVNQGVSEQETE